MKGLTAERALPLKGPCRWKGPYRWKGLPSRFGLILKRLLIHVAGCYFGLLMRELFGVGTPSLLPFGPGRSCGAPGTMEGGRGIAGRCADFLGLACAALVGDRRGATAQLVADW